MPPAGRSLGCFPPSSWIKLPHPTSPRDQVDAFTRARAVTSRWSDDPGTTPAPLKAYLAEQAREKSED